MKEVKQENWKEREDLELKFIEVIEKCKVISGEDGVALLRGFFSKLQQQLSDLKDENIKLLEQNSALEAEIFSNKIEIESLQKEKDELKEKLRNRK